MQPLTRIFSPGNPVEWHRIREILQRETIGGGLLIFATVLALIAANTSLASAYHGFQHLELGFQVGEWSFSMSLAHWAADGFLAIFFFLAGLELKREFVAGDLQHWDRALVPVAAAVGGVVAPALIFVGLTAASGPEATAGWAIPTATDIAFALAVLAVVGRRLPPALRTFLLTLAVVDDLIAISIIALFYSSNISLNYLLWALVPLAIYGLLAQRERELFKNNEAAAWLILLPIGVICWGLFVLSGVHATVAGVLLAFTIPVRDAAGESHSGLAESFEHRFRPLSAGFAVPIFAFFSAGVALPTLGDLTTNVALGVILGLVLGKPLGITLATFLVTRMRQANLDPSVSWADVIALATLAGIGFTVSLLISELSYPDATVETVKGAVLVGSVLAAVIGGGWLGWRSRQAAG